jgi:predicted deacetylase
MSSGAEARAREGLLVSIHDVTPALEAPVRRLWSLCRENGVTPALLVVPDWHGTWPLEQAAAFMEWVRECATLGAEIFLHGERHDEVGSPRGWRDELRAVGRTAREGEFLTLDHDAAQLRIARGLTRLSTLGLSPIGFIPPAWLAREATHDAVRESGLLVSEDAGGIRVHASRSRIPAPALRWSGRTTLRAWGSRVTAAVRWRTQQRAAFVRLALHPQDLAHPVTAASVEQEVARWVRARRVIRYAQL